MNGKKAKLFGIAIIFAAFLGVSINSILATNPSILDTDSSTYIIVVMLMLLLFIIFSSKAELDFSFGPKNAAYAAFIFVAYALLLSSMRVALSSAFLSYRIDALLFPLPMLALVVLVFGIKGARKLWPLIAYSVFASPLLLVPVINLSAAFANLNALLVYAIIKGIGVQVLRSGYVITSALGSSITISTACVPIGTFIAFVMFLIPVAYLYDGSLKHKLYWILSGSALMLFLNFARMLFIALIWVFYGLDNAVNTFHVFAGQLIFYAAIIIMMLVSGKYGLGLARRAKKSRRGVAAPGIAAGRLAAATVVAAAFAIAAFALNYGYYSDIHASYALFAGNAGVNAVALGNRIIGSVANSSGNVTVIGSTSIGEIFLIGHANDTDSTYIIANASYSAVPKYRIPGYTPTGPLHSYLLRNGITINAQDAYSGNSTFELNYFSIPYNISGEWVMVNYVAFRKTIPGSTPSCSAINYGSIGPVSYFESEIYNLVMMQRTSSEGFICEGYAIASG
ncbi:MAG: exosortase/archaeosortase family protein [Candidatus Micrarchaeota archaeon]|nr:exosortase/archaeosortase family protein [Candidatus Micrarchaeota archaeon]